MSTTLTDGAVAGPSLFSTVMVYVSWLFTKNRIRVGAYRHSQGPRNLTEPFADPKTIAVWLDDPGEMSGVSLVTVVTFVKPPAVVGVMVINNTTPALELKSDPVNVTMPLDSDRDAEAAGVDS